MRIRLPAMTGVMVGTLFIFAGVAAQQSLQQVSTSAFPHDTLPTSFPVSSYTPYGYIDNQYHSMILNRSGVVRSYPPLGFGWWRTDFKGAYGEGPRNHVSYLSLLQMSFGIDGKAFVDSLDFLRAGVTLSSRYHTKNAMSYDWSSDSVDVRLTYFLPRENSLACFVEVANRAEKSRSVAAHATHVYYPGEIKWWGRDGISVSYLDSTDASVSKVWAYGDVFALGADESSSAHKATKDKVLWEKWVRSREMFSMPKASFVGRGPMRTVHSYVRQIEGHSSWSFIVLLSRGKNEQWALQEFDSARISASSILSEKMNEDREFWSTCPTLEGDWPAQWKHGWVYDFETIRMNIRNPIGIFKHPWDAMQVHSPRLVLGETSMDMMTLSYANPALAKEVLYGTFADALAPNIPCVREDGSMNMISSDGSECGTAPMWGYPFLVINSIYHRTLDDAWVRDLYPFLKSYVEWWLQHRTDREGWLHCNNSWESGQDGSKRFLVAEGNEGAVADFVRTVDVEASMAEAMQIMASFAIIAQKNGESSYWEALAKKRVENTRSMFHDGWFRDVDARNKRPIILKDYHDVMMLAPLTCGVATKEQVEKVKPMFQYFASNRRLQWPPGIFTFTEAASNAGERQVAADVVAATADRVYERTDSRSPLFVDSEFAYRIPGVANEFWPLDNVPAGGENYGWGATLPLYIIRNIIGFRESAEAASHEFALAPTLPVGLLQQGKTYTIRNLHWSEISFDITWRVGKGKSLSVTLEYRTRHPLTFSVVNEQGEAIAEKKGGDAIGSIVFNAVNGAAYRIRMQ